MEGNNSQLPVGKDEQLAQAIQNEKLKYYNYCMSLNAEGNEELREQEFVEDEKVNIIFSRLHVLP